MTGRIVSAFACAFGIVLALYVGPRLTPIETALVLGFIVGSACTAGIFAIFILLVIVPARSARAAAERRY